jgi:steroid delta-isomerase-like uncharacterized protein
MSAQEVAVNLIDQFRTGIEAVNNKDWEKHRSLLATKFHYTGYAAEMCTTNRDDFVAMQRTAADASPDQRITITSIAMNGNTVIAEITTEGTHTAPLLLPTGGEIPATGKHYTTHVAVVTEYDGGGKATVCRAYYNPLELMAQLGVMPEIPQQISLEDKATAKTR